MKKIFKKVILITLCVIVAITCITCFLDYLRLMNLTHQLSEFPVPKETVVLEQRSASGDMAGMGAETQDFMTVLLVKSSLSEDELRDYYKTSAFKTVLSGAQIRKLISVYTNLLVAKPENEDGTYAVEVFVNQVTESKLTTIQIESLTIDLNKTLVFSKLDGIIDYSNYYFIILSDAQYPWSLDISLIYATLHSLFFPNY